MRNPGKCSDPLLNNKEAPQIHEKLRDAKDSVGRRDRENQKQLAGPVSKDASSIEESKKQADKSKRPSSLTPNYLQYSQARPVLQHHSMPASTARADSAKQQEAIVSVHIGRVEIKATTPQDPLPRPKKFAPPLFAFRLYGQRKKRDRDKR